MSPSMRAPGNAELQRIRAQLRAAVLGDAWHGPAVADSVAALTVREAWTRLTPATHSPVEILLHIASWLEIVARRFGGEHVTEANAEDWPPAPDSSADAWRACVARLQDAHRALDDVLAAADDRSLTETVPGQTITKYEMLHGVIQHCSYHAGQIMLIRRATGG